MRSGSVPQATGTLQTCEARVNSFGSPYWAFLADPEFVAGMARAEIQKSFRRVILDPARGLVVLMSPARAHERISDLAATVIGGMASFLGIPAVSLRSTRWRRRSDPPNTGPEPDCCFYVGDRARDYLMAEARGEQEADRYVLHNPPTIVVEVGVTHVDARKLEVYQDRGVQEFWQLDRPKDGEVLTASFMSMPPDNPPFALRESVAMPGITTAMFENAIRAAALEFDSRAVLEAVGEVMTQHGAIASWAHRQ